MLFSLFILFKDYSGVLLKGQGISLVLIQGLGREILGEGVPFDVSLASFFNEVSFFTFLTINSLLLTLFLFPIQ